MPQVQCAFHRAYKELHRYTIYLHTATHVPESGSSQAAHLGQHSQPQYTLPITHTPPPHTPPHVPVSPDPAPVPAKPFTRTVPLISAYVVTVAFASTTIAPPPLPPAFDDDTPPDPCTYTRATNPSPQPMRRQPPHPCCHCPDSSTRWTRCTSYHQHQQTTTQAQRPHEHHHT